MTELPNGPHLIYFADPMCSWCWGFSPVLAAIQHEFGNHLPIYPIMGGLRPYTNDPMTETDKESVRSHWQHVHERTQQPFDFAFFDREGFVYDSEPSCRAVVILRRRSAEIALAGLRLIHAGFYMKNRDVTDAEELIAVAGAMGCEPNDFRIEFAKPDATRETRQDFALSRKVGVQGFPTMLASAGAGKEYAVVTTGYRDASTALPSLRNWRAAIK